MTLMAESGQETSASTSHHSVNLSCCRQSWELRSLQAWISSEISVIWSCFIASVAHLCTVLSVRIIMAIIRAQYKCLCLHAAASPVASVYAFSISVELEDKCEAFTECKTSKRSTCCPRPLCNSNQCYVGLWLFAVSVRSPPFLT